MAEDGRTDTNKIVDGNEHESEGWKVLGVGIVWFWLLNF